ncbi:MAG TPA: tandem-95 repeat protein, partial [Gammaproteobacteria bacterium]|nr:tandem-95 repeat protein [Gammaproteobacteria bacterium]
LEWAVEHDIDIASISMGGPDSVALREACDSAYQAGVLIVAAAGNTLHGKVDYPAAYGSVVAVGATDREDQPESYTAKGNEVELSAPGAKIHSTKRDGQYGTASGTSQATPHVSGVAALILSAGVNDLNNDGLTNNRDVRLQLLMATRDLGDPGWDDLYGYGIIDVNRIFNSRPIQLPDLSLSIRDDRDPVFRGHWFNYSLTIQNNGAADATDAKLLLTNPVDMAIKGDNCTPVDGRLNADSGGSENSDPVMECQVGWIAKNGGTRTLDIAAKMMLPGVTSTAVTKARVVTPLEANTADNSIEESTTISNRPPTAGKVRIDAVMNTAITTDNVLHFARDQDRDTLYIDSSDSVSRAGGTVINHGDGTFTYTPPKNFTGSDSFNYVISDGHGGTAIGTVEIKVRIALTIDIEDSADPVIAGENIVYTITVTNSSPVDVTTIKLLIDTQGETGIGVLSLDNNCEKIANNGAICMIEKIGKNGGAVQLQITAKALAPTTTHLYALLISDNDNIHASYAREKTTIIKPNSNPIAGADHASTDENTPLTITSMLDNDTDADGDRLHIAAVDEISKQGGTVTLANNGSIIYTPPAGFNGEDTFQYTISDNKGGIATGTVTITVNNSSDPSPPEENLSVPWAGASGLLMLLILFVHILGTALLHTRYRARTNRNR